MLLTHMSRVLSCVLLLLPCIPPSNVFALPGDNDAANVGNVRFEAVGDQIAIYYDLLGSTDNEYQVTVFLRKESDASFRYKLVNTSGDAGPGISWGAGKKILWNMKREFPEGLSGEDFYFVVNAQSLKSEPFPLLWAGVGVAVLGGITTYFLLHHNEPDAVPAATGSFPAPPGRP